MSSFQLTAKEKNRLREIAAYYGVKVIFDPAHPGGSWDWNKKDIINIGGRNTLHGTLSQFFHEIAHAVNYQTGKYPLFHDVNRQDELLKRIPSYRARIRYRLRAEVYTEKVGKRLMKEWFPDIKYDEFYKNNDECYWFLHGYYLTGG